MKVAAWCFALLTGALPVIATDDGEDWGLPDAADIVKAWEEGKKHESHGGNAWAVANPYIDQPDTDSKGSVSPDGTCGGRTGYTCKGSAWGDCCGKNGWCGSTEDYCGVGCNKAFGQCGVSSSSSEPTGRPSSSKKAKVTVTSTLRTSTTICSTTMLFTTSTTESDSTFLTTSTLTTTLPYSTHTVIEHPSDYPSGHSGSASGTTVYTTTFTTAYPTTYTITESGSTSLSTGTTTETQTSLLTSTGYASPTAPTSYSTSPVKPSSYTGRTTVTEILTSYTTKCPVTETITSDGSTSLTTYTTISTVTSTISSTITSSSTTTGAVGTETTTNGNGSPSSYIIVSSTPIYRSDSCFTTTINGTVTTISTSPTSTENGSGETSSPTTSTSGHLPSDYTIVSSTPIYRSDSCFTTTINGTVTTISTSSTTTGNGAGETTSSTISTSGHLPSEYTIVSSTPIYRSDSCFTTTINGTVTTISGNSSTPVSGATKTSTTTSEATSGNGHLPSGYTIVSSTPIYRSGSCFTTTVNGTVTTISSTRASSGFGTGTTTATSHSSIYSPSGGSSISYPGGNGTTVGPVGTGTTSQHPSYSIVSSYPIYRSGSCFTTAGNSSVPQNSTSSVGPVGTGTGLPSSSMSHTVSNSANATITNGPTATHTPVGTGSGSSGFPSNSANATRTLNHTSTSTCRSKPTQSDFCVPCQGQPGNDPNTWCGLDVTTDSYQNTPKTCRTVEYHMTITNTTVAPDGVERLGLLINGQFPGPTIEANWGDTIIVHLTNAMQDNGTSLHFHGMRQHGTNEMDGVPSITQCALAPGDSMTYKFVASNYGTSWYHSHWGLQTFDGVFGAMVIHGPSSKEYDVDAGPMVLTDWNHVSVNEIYDSIQQATAPPGPPTLDTGLINGKNVWGDGGERFEMEFESGKSYLMRVINCAIQATFKFSIDGHKFWVVSTDFVPIVPYETDTLNVNIGQRYNIIVVADQAPAAYWMRADNQISCSPITNYNQIKGIVRYKGSDSGLVGGLVSNLTSGTPLTLPHAAAIQGSCADEPAASLVPIVQHTVGPQGQNVHETVLVGAGPSTPNLYKWTLNGATFQSQWGDPTLNQILRNGTVPDYSGQLAIEVPNLGEWVYIVIETPIPVPHPIHLHGHDFYILTSGIGLWDGDTSVFQLNNPPRRDVAMMPGGVGPGGAGGHLVLAFYTDNPGAWLMHCHIGWHAQMGFALQVVENVEGIQKLDADTCKMQNTCKNWHAYAKEYDMLVMPDSGI